MIDNPDYIEPKRNRPDHCSECGGDGNAQDGGQCETCRGSGDWTESEYCGNGPDGEVNIKMFEAPPHDYVQKASAGIKNIF